MDTREVVLDVIASVSGSDRAAMTPGTELVSELRIDSPKALQMLLEIEDRLGIEIDDEAVARLHTVGDVLDAAERVSA